MSKLGEQLRAFRMHSTYGLLAQFGEKGMDVAISYAPAERARAQKTTVWSPSFQTNPTAAWYDHGRMPFVGNQKESWPKAVAWATKTYGITEWAPCPLIRGTWVPRYVLDRAKQFVKNATQGDAA